MRETYLPGEKFLMPFQTKPFNGDTFVCDKFIELRDKFNIKLAVELGCCVGGTTKWLSQNFDRVIGVEIMPNFLSIAAERVGECKSEVILYEGNTTEWLPKILKNINEQFILFEDAHWTSNNPLLDELQIIADHKLRPVLAIHDMLVPGHKELGFDTYENIVYEWKWIESHIEKIYGKDYVKEYNSKAVGAKRGILYVYPK